MLETRLIDRRYAAEDSCTMADMAIRPCNFTAEEKENDLATRRHLRRWICKIGARPAVQRERQIEIGLRRSMDVSAQSMKVLYGQI